MDSLNKYNRFISLQREKLWPINTTQKIQIALAVSKSIPAPFFLTAKEIIEDSFIRNKLGYESEELAKKVFSNHSFYSPSTDKCWIIFHKVILGSGQQAKVELALEVNSGDVDVRYSYTFKSEVHVQQFLDQVNCLKEFIGNQKVIQYKAHYVLPSNPYTPATGAMFAGYCSNGDLLEATNGGHSVVNCIPRIISVVKDIHEKGFIHRDIKLENFFIDENEEIKLGDFGFVCKVNTSQTLKVSPEYCPIEYVDEDNKTPVTQKADMWSLGLVIYALIYRSIPSFTSVFKITSKYRSKSEIRKEALQKLKEFNALLLNSPINCFLKQFFVVDPALRPSIHEIKPVHEFFSPQKLPNTLFQIRRNHPIEADVMQLLHAAKVIVLNNDCGSTFNFNSILNNAEIFGLSPEEIKAKWQKIEIFYHNPSSLLIIFRNVMTKQVGNKKLSLAYDAFRDKVVHCS